MGRKVGIKVDSLINQMTNVRNYVLQNVQHANFPDLNYSPGCDEILEFPEWKITMPWPIYISSVLLGPVDVCHKRTMAHSNYWLALKAHHSNYKVFKKKKTCRGINKKGIQPYVVLDFAELLEKNPDKYFKGKYDWYYTGGNLTNVQYNNETLIMHAIGENLENLAISKINSNLEDSRINDITYKTLPNVGKHIEEFPEILEIQNYNEDNNELFISARQKYSISIFTYNNEELIFKTSLINKEIPFISSTFQRNSKSNFITSNLNKIVKLWDLNISTKKSQQILFKSSNNIKIDENWNHIKSIDENQFGFVDSKQFYHLDSRIKYDEFLRNSCNFMKFTIPCENITSMSISKLTNNLIYFGTTHKLFAIDTRYMKNDEQSDYIVLKWTHQMDMPPLFLNTIRNNDKELIALSSLQNGDIRICENVFDNIKEITNMNPFQSLTLPIRPLTISDSYNKARINGKCLDPTVNIDKHLNTSNSGQCFIMKNHKLLLLTANSNCNILAHQFINNENEEIELNKKIIKLMDNWEIELNQIKLNKTKTLHITDYENLSGLNKILRCKILDEDTKNVNDNLPKPYRHYRWQRPFEQLQLYKDALASEMLSIWDIDINTNNKIRTIKLPDLQNHNDIVTDWLNNTTTMKMEAEEIETHHPMVRIHIPPDSSNTNCMELSGIDDIFTKRNSKDNNDFDITLQSEEVTFNQRTFENSQLDTRKKTQKRRKRHVQGF